MRVAAGLDEYDHRAREFCELVVVQAEALCLVTPRLRESLQIAQREAFALQLGELVGLQRLEQRSQQPVFIDAIVHAVSEKRRERRRAACMVVALLYDTRVTQREKSS